MGEPLNPREGPVEAYAGVCFVLLTQHGKEQVMTPLFSEAFDASVLRVEGFDTDQLGTFTRETPRAGSQLEAARKKATLAIELSGQPLGLGSEGSFNPGPFGAYAINLELVALVDSTRGLEIVGTASEGGQHRFAEVRRRSELVLAATGLGFPEHALVVRPNHADDLHLQKGVGDWPTLIDAFERAQGSSVDGTVVIENELRAHLNPTRRRTIGLATRDLIERMKSLCPRCRAPGFGPFERLPGLPCRDCGRPSNRASAEKWACISPGCRHPEVRLLPAGAADPTYCDTCNP